MQERENLHLERDKILAAQALAQSKERVSLSHAEQAVHQQHLTNQKNEKDTWLLALDTELQMRPALSFGCFFFALIGCPVGIWFSKSDYLSAFITCFLPIVFIYYPLQLCSTNLARDGRVPPAASLWAANALLGMIAVFLFYRLLRN